MDMYMCKYVALHAMYVLFDLTYILYILIIHQSPISSDIVTLYSSDNQGSMHCLYMYIYIYIYIYIHQRVSGHCKCPFCPGAPGTVPFGWEAPRWNVNHPMGLWAVTSLGCHVLGLICSFQHPAGCLGPRKSRRHGRPSKEGYLPRSGPQPPFCAGCRRNYWLLWRRHYCLPP